MTWAILLVLVAGFLVGRMLGQRGEKMGKILTVVGLFVLLFAMGMRLGGDRSIRTQLVSFGVAAFWFALASGIGAVAFAVLFERIARGRRSR
ncbi:MAG: LysO family transporter [Atribacterota bacterium]